MNNTTSSSNKGTSRLTSGLPKKDLQEYELWELDFLQLEDMVLKQRQAGFNRTQIYEALIKAQSLIRYQLRVAIRKEHH